MASFTRLATTSRACCTRQLPGSLLSASSHRAAVAPQSQLRSWQCQRLYAAKDDDAATAGDEQPSTSGSSSTTPASRVGALAGQLDSHKAFVSEEEWRVMDKKVNKYPSQRTFTAIGTGGDDFKANMKQAVESVVGTVHLECVSDRPSSGGKYISVRIGPVWVESGDQVIQVFNNMRKDERLKWYM